MFKWIRRLAVFVVVLIIGIQCYRIHANIQHVLTYESMVKEVLAEDDIDNTTNVDLVLAMIYTETKGKTDDVMQSSESSTGVTNSITDRKESIRQGVTVLSENLEEAAHHKVILGQQYKPIILVRPISIMWLIMVELTPSNSQRLTLKMSLLRV